MSATSISTTAPTSTQSTPGYDLSKTVGVTFWGFLVATLLLGVTIVQGFIYFNNNRDKPSLKWLVTSMIALDVTSSSLVSQVLYHILIQNYGNADALIQIPVTLAAEYAVTSLVAALSQLFYASQIYKLDRRSFRHTTLAMVISIFAVAALALNIVAAVLLFEVNLIIADINPKQLKIITGLGDSFAAVSDLLASGALCVFLVSHRTGLTRGRKLVDLLMLYTVNRGFLFSTMQIGRMIAYFVAPSTNYWIAFHLCLSKLHVNSLLTLLNSRATLRGSTLELSKIDFHIDPSIAARRSQPDVGRLHFETAVPKTLENLRLERITKDHTSLSLHPHERGRRNNGSSKEGKPVVLVYDDEAR